MPPVLSSVEFWPATGFVDRPWCEEPELDTWVKTSRRVCEAYSAALAPHKLDATFASLRLATSAMDADDDALSGDIVVYAHADNSSEGAHVTIPLSVADVPPLVRAMLVLEVLDCVLRQIAPFRAWSLESIEEVRQEVLDTGLQFSWSGREVSSRDRRRTARTHFTLSDSGFGEVKVEILERGSKAVLGVSSPLLAYSTIEGFKRSSKSLRWTDRDHLTIVHFDDAFGIDQRSASIDVERDLQPMPPLRAQIPPASSRQPVFTTPRVVLPPPPQARISGGSGGPTNYVPHLYYAATLWMFDHIPPALTAWWAETGLLELSVYYDFAGSKHSARLYRRGDDIEATLRRPMPDPDADRDPIGTAHQDIMTVLAAVQRRFKLPSPPDLPRPAVDDLDELVAGLVDADSDQYPLDLEKLKDVLPPEILAILQEAEDLGDDP